MTTGDQRIATFYIGRHEIDVYGCWDSETPEQEFDSYDLYQDGECVNEVDPFYTFPTWLEVRESLDLREAVA